MVILLSPRVKRRKDIKILNTFIISDLTLSLKKPAYKTMPPYLILHVFATPLSL
jgi:hypothetical protein